MTDKLRDDIMSAEGFDNLISDATTALDFLKALRQALNEPNALDTTDENGAALLVDVINAASTDLMAELLDAKPTIAPGYEHAAEHGLQVE